MLWKNKDSRKKSNTSQTQFKALQVIKVMLNLLPSQSMYQVYLSGVKVYIWSDRTNTQLILARIYKLGTKSNLHHWEVVNRQEDLRVVMLG